MTTVLQPHETWNVLDATKLVDYIRCPRRYFYAYILGWKLDEPNFHLAFGIAWHRAQEHLLAGKYGPEAVEKAKLAFLRSLKEAGIDESSFTEAKNFDRGLLAIDSYAKNYQNAPEIEDDLLHTEVVGEVYISSDFKIKLFYRLDKVLRGPEGVYAIEHKTCSEASERWARQWQLSSQITLYQHALACIFENVYGVIVDGVAFKKTGIDFIRVPVRKTPDMLDAWLEETVVNCLIIRGDLDFLMESDLEGYRVLPIFRRREEGCEKYGGCDYHDLCCNWANPLQHLDQIPAAFKVEFWDPRKDVSPNAAVITSQEAVK